MGKSWIVNIYRKKKCFRLLHSSIRYPTRQLLTHRTLDPLHFKSHFLLVLPEAIPCLGVSVTLNLSTKWNNEWAKRTKANHAPLIVEATSLCPGMSEGALLTPREYSGKVTVNRTFQRKSFQSRSSSDRLETLGHPLDPFRAVCEVMTVYKVTPRCYLPSPCPFSWVHRDFPTMHWGSLHYSVDQCFPDDWLTY